MKPDLFWVPGTWPGKVAIAARPRGGDWLADEAQSWRAAGVEIVVSLLEAEETSDLDLDGEEAAVGRAGLRYISFPIVDRGVPESLPATAALLRSIVEWLEAGKTIAVHCRQGIGRSGLIVAGALVTAGASPESAMRVVSAARGLTVPETPDQVRWLQRLPTGHLAFS